MDFLSTGHSNLQMIRGQRRRRALDLPGARVNLLAAGAGAAHAEQASGDELHRCGAFAMIGDDMAGDQGVMRPGPGKGGTGSSVSLPRARERRTLGVPPPPLLDSID